MTIDLIAYIDLIALRLIYNRFNPKHIYRSVFIFFCFYLKGFNMKNEIVFNPMSDFTTNELANELLDRVKHTNGIEFVNSVRLSGLIAKLSCELFKRIKMGDYNET